eukprot:3939668-Pleurochrysis_carterae.AAC.2
MAVSQWLSSEMLTILRSRSCCSRTVNQIGEAWHMRCISSTRASCLMSKRSSIVLRHAPLCSAKAGALAAVSAASQRLACNSATADTAVS